MPLPKAIQAGGRILYQDSAGQFISKAKYELLQRKDPRTGRFISKAAAARRGNLQSVENYLRSQLGAPPSGKNWIQIASKYAERFSDYLADLE